MWQERAKRCPLCGEALIGASLGGRARRRCSSCGFVLYLNPACASAGVVLNPRGEVLLVLRAIDPFRGHWALPAGYQEIDEEPALTVVREVREEAGIEVVVVGLLDLLFIPDDPRKPANVAVFLCRATGGELRPGPEEEDAGWFDLAELPGPIGFDNSERILERLRVPGGYPESPWSVLRGLLDERKGPRP